MPIESVSDTDLSYHLIAFCAADPADLPGPATAPVPADGAIGQGLDVQLGWVAGAQTDSFDVYFGTAFPLDEGDLQGNQPGTTYNPGPLLPGTTYYWRVDGENDVGIARGCTWSLETEPGEQELIMSDGFEGAG